MSRTRKSAAALGGAAWMKATGQRPIGLTLPDAEYRRFRSLAGSLGLSAAELSRRLARWSLKCFEDNDLRILKKIADGS